MSGLPFGSFVGLLHSLYQLITYDSLYLLFWVSKPLLIIQQLLCVSKTLQLMGFINNNDIYLLI